MEDSNVGDAARYFLDIETVLANMLTGIRNAYLHDARTHVTAHEDIPVFLERELHCVSQGRLCATAMELARSEQATKRRA